MCAQLEQSNSRLHTVKAQRNLRIERAGRYAKPEHMPVLFSRAVINEMESRWPSSFTRTRRNRLRQPNDLELNFLYSHYLRVQRFPARPIARKRLVFRFVQDCASPAGARRCAASLAERPRFVCFNDKASSVQEFNEGTRELHKLLRQRFGSFDGDLSSRSIEDGSRKRS